MLQNDAGRQDRAAAPRENQGESAAPRVSSEAGFHIALHARPASVVSGPLRSLEDRTYRTLQIAPGELQIPLARSFEEASQCLAALPRLFIEPDGSFVWVADQAAPAWQIDGHLYDRHGHLLYVELRGACPRCEFDRLLAALGWPAQPLLVQSIRHAVFLELEAFRDGVP